jgi:hypothetical protein
MLLSSDRNSSFLLASLQPRPILSRLVLVYFWYSLVAT